MHWPLLPGCFVRLTRKPWHRAGGRPGALRTSRRCPLRLEALEDRRCPTVTVTAFSGNLAVSGTPSGAVAITETTPNSFQVTDGSFTSANFTVTGSIAVTLSGTAAQSVTFDVHGNTAPGNVSFSLGDGGNSLLVESSTAPGSIAGVLSVLSGSGADQVTLGDFAHALTVNGATTVNTGAGADTLNVADAVTLSSYLLLSNVNTFNLGGGTSGTVNGLISFSSNAEPAVPDAISFANGSNTRDVSLVTGDGADVVTLNGTVTGNVSASLGAGGNTFNVNGTVTGNTNVYLGSDPSHQNAVAFGTTANLSGTGSLTLTGGAGTDNVTLDGTINNRLIFVSLGDGPNTLLLNGTLSLPTTPATPTRQIYYSGGAGSDAVFLDNFGSGPSSLVVNATLSVSLGGGSNFFGDNSHGGVVINGNVSVSGGAGSDQVGLNGTINGNLSTSLGDGTNATTLGPGSSVTGSLSVLGGSGDDTAILEGPVGGPASVNLGDSVLENEFVVSGVTIGKGLSYVGGAGQDFVEVVNSSSAGPVINGNAQFFLGDGPNRFFFLKETHPSQINGPLTVFCGSGSDFLSVSGTVTGGATINMGDGSNTLFFAGSVGGAMLVVGGSGNDDVSGFGGTVQGGSLTLSLGDGTNTFTFAGTMTAPGATLVYVGGGGTDDVTFNGTVAAGTTLGAFLGAGDDVFTFNTFSNLASLFLDGGPGTDTAQTTVAIPSTVTLISINNFEPNSIVFV